jgi:hypothetical protein
MLMVMPWSVVIHPAFATEVADFDQAVQAEIVAAVAMLERFGPQLGRPHCDTLNGSEHRNMKEYRFSAADGVWRLAFAFDPDRQAVLLVAGDKSGMSSKKFYKALIRKADERFNDWLE